MKVRGRKADEAPGRISIAVSARLGTDGHDSPVGPELIRTGGGGVACQFILFPQTDPWVEAHSQSPSGFPRAWA